MLILIPIVVGLVFLIRACVKIKKRQEAEEAAFLSKHAGWETYISTRDRTAFGLNMAGGKMVIGKLDSYIEWDVNLLSSIKIEKNGQTAVMTNRGSQVVGAAVGGLLLGPLGLLVGGVTGTKRQNERINQLALIITLDDPRRPIHRVVFFKAAGKGVPAKSRALIAAAERLEHFHALLFNFLKTHSAVTEVAASAHERPVESRIAALWELKMSGALSADEYVREKSRLLGT